MNILNSISERITSISYTLDHRKAFLMVEKNLLGHNTLSGYLHDLDKVFLKLILSPETVSSIHRKYSRHHSRSKTRQDYIQKVIDWECARYTKPDKPLNARETLYKYYPEQESDILPLLEEFGL